MPATMTAMGPAPARTIDAGKVADAQAGLADATAVRRWSDRFALLSDPNRLRLLIAIHRAPHICVSDLAAATGMSDTSVSQALRLLRNQGWVTSGRAGRLVLYALDDDTVHDLLHMLGAGHAPSHQ